MKQALRNEMRRLLRWPEVAVRAAASRQAQGRLIAQPEFRRARRVAIYWALPEEVGTERIREACHDDGREIAVPAWQPDRGAYGFSLWLEGAPTVAGPLGIPQPAQPVWVAAETMDLIVVPGLAFDRLGGRLGRGKGFYDRLLAAAGPACKVGLAFRWQICDRVPMEPHDIRMDLVVTDDAVYRAVRATGA